MTLIYDAHEELCEWASVIIFGVKDHFKGSKCIGVLKDGKIICAVVYNNYYLNPDKTPLSLEMSIASVDKRWATRHNIRAFFNYPFIQLGLERVTTLCSANEGDIMNFNKRLGFKQEGVHSKAYAYGVDAISFGMLKSQCKWIIK